jgi:hypothetical protein
MTKVPLHPLNIKLVSFAVSCAAIAALSMAPLNYGVTKALNPADMNALALLAERSPGSRPNGALIASKPLAQSAARPRQYAMPRLRERVAPGGLAAPVQSFGQPAALFPRDASAVPLENIPSVTGPGSYYPFPGGGDLPGGIIIPPVATGTIPPGLGTPPGGGGLLPGGSNNPPGNSVPPGVGRPNSPAPTAVPEPATWLNLIIGFGAVGMVMRAKRWKPASRAWDIPRSSQ